MVQKRSEYTDEELVNMYCRYAHLKGWSTEDTIVSLKVEAWRAKGIGPVGLAIDFYETGKDNAKHLGKDAEEEATAKKSIGCVGFLVVFAILLVALFVVIGII